LLPGVRAVIDFLAKALRPADILPASAMATPSFQPRNGVSPDARLVAAATAQ
jgi:hypothetical protein